MIVKPIVEGEGEVAALPVLLRRVATEHFARPLHVLPPIRVPRGQLGKESELTRAVLLASKYVSRPGPLLVLLDADRECPAALGPRLSGWALAARRDYHTSVVVANNEFEAWFVAAAASLSVAGKLQPGTAPHPTPESVQDAKGWLSERMGRRYSPTTDQASFAALCDLRAAASCPSFAKLLREMRAWFAGPAGPADATGSSADS